MTCSDIHGVERKLASTNISDTDYKKIYYAFSQLETISKDGWIRYFLENMVQQIRKWTKSRPLARRKAAKKQVELILAHFRNFFKADALIQIQ